MVSFCKGGLWVGWTDERQEGNFTNVNNQELLDIQLGEDLYFSGQPSGGKRKNCVAASFSLKSWFDKPCHFEYISFCHLHTHPIFKVRGKLLNLLSFFLAEQHILSIFECILTTNLALKLNCLTSICLTTIVYLYVSHYTSMCLTTLACVSLH
jgi:hypothetical protein